MAMGLLRLDTGMRYCRTQVVLERLTKTKQLNTLVPCGTDHRATFEARLSNQGDSTSPKPALTAT